MKTASFSILVFLVLCSICCASSHPLERHAGSSMVTGKDRCVFLGQKMKWCATVEDVTRFVFDLPRTFSLIKDGLQTLAKNVVQVLEKSSEQVIAAAMTIPVDLMMRMPNHIKAAIQRMVSTTNSVIDFIEKESKNPSFKELKEYVQVSRLAFIITVGQTVDGLIMGLEKSGYQTLAYVAHSLFETIAPMLSPIVDLFFEKVIQILSFNCTHFLPTTVCESAFTAYRAFLDPFWKFMHGPVKDIRDAFLEVVYSLLDRYSFPNLLLKLEGDCEKMFPKKWCKMVQHVVQGFDQFSQKMLSNFEKGVDAAVNWIARHVFEDVSVTGGRVAADVMRWKM